MKKYLLLSVLAFSFISAISQSANSFAGDADKAYGIIKNTASKRSYKELIKFASTNHAAINVDPNTTYEIFFVYDNSKHQAPNFQAHLMTPDSALMKKYTVKSFDRAQVGAARVA